MNIGEKLRCEALNNGKLFSKSLSKCSKFYLPPEQCGFTRSYETKTPLRWTVNIDLQACLSLAAVNKQNPNLHDYANKTNIMVINVSRLSWTCEAFKFLNQVSQTTVNEQALQFYFKTDYKHRDKKLPPNHQFSNFLHRLKSSGYLDYIFDLAREINLNVDIILSGNQFVRYQKTHVNLKGKVTSTAIGYITAIQHGDRWYVKTTQFPVTAAECEVIF